MLESVTIKELKLEAANLKHYRAVGDVKAAELLSALEGFLDYSSAKDFAGKIGVTPQYLSDIRNGRRAISDEFLGKLVRIK